MESFERRTIYPDLFQGVVASIPEDTDPWSWVKLVTIQATKAELSVKSAEKPATWNALMGLAWLYMLGTFRVRL
jgi:hypothetical protein